MSLALHYFSIVISDDDYQAIGIGLDVGSIDFADR